MRRKFVLGLFLACPIALSAVAFAQQSPYAGQQARPIKALSSADLDALTNGTGMGMAKAGELNGYPGPAHILMMAAMLNLTANQTAAITAIKNRMSNSAKALGATILDREQILDRQFATGTINPTLLSEETGEIGRLQGQLRAVHLKAHIETKAALTAEQITAYNKMRGYAP
jgi:Spy/CpxP family protein refolding chaperone